jgi:hypothetical protein
LYNKLFYMYMLTVYIWILFSNKILMCEWLRLKKTFFCYYYYLLWKKKKINFMFII